MAIRPIEAVSLVYQQARPRVPQMLTRQAFAAYGDVIEVASDVPHFTINQGFTERYNNLAEVDVLRNQGHAQISLFRSSPLPTPVEIKMLERHPLSSQAFMPLSNNPYLVVVAAAGDLNTDDIQVFLAQANQGVNYRAGTWHHFCLALHEQSDFLVIDRAGEGNNCDEVVLEQPFAIALQEEHPQKGAASTGSLS